MAWGSGGVVAGVGLLAALVLATVASGQTLVAPAIETDAVEDGPTVSPAVMSARLIERAALIDLRLKRAPVAEDYRLATRALQLSLRMDPGSAWTARQAAAAAWGAGDSELLAEATRAVMRADPDDTTAQLRLITNRVARMQTAEARLAAYDRFLGSRGAALDPGVRSRLAVDAALLNRELGDTEAFGRLLDLAMALDSSNKEAVKLADAFITQTLDDPMASLRAKIRLLYADPLDPTTHVDIVNILSQEGAFEQAGRFQTTSRRLLAAAGMEDTTADSREMALMWYLQGPERVVESSTSVLRGTREQARVKYEADLLADIPESQLTPPETIHLEPSMEFTRTLAAAVTNNEEILLESFGEFEAITQERLDRLADIPEGVEPEALQRVAIYTLRPLARLQLARILAGRDTDKFVAGVTKFNLGGAIWQRLVEPMVPWVTYVEEGPEVALAQLGPVPAVPTSEAFETLALRGRCLEDLGETAAAIEAYATVVRKRSTDPLAAWAREQALRLDPETELLTRQGAAMEALAASVPDWLLELDLDPTRYVSFDLDVESHPTDPVLRFRMRNTLGLPLAVGSDRPISSRVLTTPTPSSSYRPIGVYVPEVHELNPVLRLGPGERLEVTAPALPGFVGLLSEIDAPALRQLSWRGLQDFRQSNYGAIVAGPFALSDRTDAALLRAPALTRASPEALVAALEDAGPDSLPLVARAAGMALFRLSGVEDQAGASVLASALASEFASASPSAQLVMLGSVPNAAQLGDARVFDDAVRSAVASGGVDPTVIGVAVLTRASVADDPLVQAGLAAGDEVVVDLAGLHAQRLRDGRSAYATAGPGWRALAPRGGSVYAGKRGSDNR